MNFLYKKHPKGTYEYADYKKKIDIVLMVGLFLLALGLFAIGYFTTGSKKNLLTIVAVLGLLPACKQVVAVIMSLRVRACTQALKSNIDSHIGRLYGMYHLYFTSYDKNFFFAHAVITDNSVLCLDIADKVDEKAFNAHITDLLLKDGIKDVLIKVFKDEEKYLKRLDELNASTEDKTADIRVISLIGNVTL